MRVDSAGLKKFFWSSLFRDSSFGKNHDLVGTAYCPHTVCNDENSFLFDQTGKSALNQRFVLDVQTCGGLVQKNDRGVF